MQEREGRWEAGLKVFKEERAGKGSSHEAQSRPAGREPAGQPLAVQQAAPARFSCQTAWASRTPPDIAAWYFSPEAPDIYSHFQSGWARKDPQDSIDWIFRMVAPRRRTRHRRTRQQAQTFTLRRWPPRWSHRQGGLHRWHSSGGKEDDRPDEEGQPAISIDIIGQARPEFQEHISRLLKTEKEEQTTTHPSSEPSEPKPTLGSHRSRGRKCVRFFSMLGRASRYSDARIR